MEFIPNIPSLRSSKARKIAIGATAGIGGALIGSSSIHTLSKKEDNSWLVALENQKRDNIGLSFENSELSQVVQVQNDLLKALCKEYEWKDTKFNMRCEEDEENIDELE